MYVDPALISWAVDVATATRRPGERGLDDVKEYVSYGASPRGPISLIAASRALALIRGRDYVVPADLETLVRDAFRHRLVLSYRALAEEVARRTRCSTRSWPSSRFRRSTSAAARTPRRGMANAADPLAPTRTPEHPGPGNLSASSLRALELAVGRRVDGLLAGDYRSAFAGVGSELWQLLAVRARRRRASDRVERHGANRSAARSRRSSSPSVCSSPGSSSTRPASMAFGTGDRPKADVA